MFRLNFISFLPVRSGLVWIPKTVLRLQAARNSWEQARRVREAPVLEFERISFSEWFAAQFPLYWRQ